MSRHPAEFELGHDTAPDPRLQEEIEKLDARLRQKFGTDAAQTAAGVLDLQTGRLALIHPDRIEYAASIPKIGILLAYFALRPDAGGIFELDRETRHQLGLMIKASSNEIAAQFSRSLGLKNIQRVLN